jgi:hypothetical protein
MLWTKRQPIRFSQSFQLFVTDLSVSSQGQGLFLFDMEMNETELHVLFGCTSKSLCSQLIRN